MTHGVINALRSLDQARKNFIEIIYRKSIIHPEVGHCSLWARSITIPQLHLRVSLTAKQDHLSLSATGYEHEHGIWLLETREVKEVTILSERVLGISTPGDLPSTRHNRDAVPVHHAHEFLASSRKFRFRNLHC